MGFSKSVQFSDHHKGRKSFFSRLKMVINGLWVRQFARDVSNYETLTCSERSTPPKIPFAGLLLYHIWSRGPRGHRKHILSFLPKDAKIQFASERAIPEELHTVASAVSVVVFVFLSPFLLRVMFCPRSPQFLWRPAVWFKDYTVGLGNKAPGSIASFAC